MAQLRRDLARRPSPVDAGPVWCAMRWFGRPAATGVDRWLDGLAAIEERHHSVAGRVAAAWVLADRLGLGAAVRRWVASR